MKSLIFATIILFSFSCKKEEELTKEVKMNSMETVSSRTDIRRVFEKTSPDENKTKNIVHFSEEQLSRYYYQNVWDSSGGRNYCPDKFGNATIDKDKCVSFSKENIENLQYPPLGFGTIAELFHKSLEAYYRNCKKYPKKSNSYELLKPKQECVNRQSDKYIDEVVESFLEIKNNNYVKILSENKIHSFRMLFISNYQSKRLEKFHPFDSNRNMNGAKFYIGCEKESCVFFNLETARVKKLDTSLKKQYLHKYCEENRFSYSNEKNCKLSKNEWPHLVRLHEKLLTTLTRDY